MRTAADRRAGLTINDAAIIDAELPAKIPR